MRYVIETTDDGNQQNVWNRILKLQSDGLITVVEKGDPIEDMKNNLRKIARAVQLLEKIGLDEDVMIAYLHDKSHVSKTNIRAVLDEQNTFFKKIGVELK